jgi:hypothetical protein
MSIVDAPSLLRAMESSLRTSVGPVGGLILRKKWRDIVPPSAEQVGADEARALVYELGAALSIVMGEAGASKAVDHLRAEIERMGLRTA